MPKIETIIVKKILTDDETKKLEGTILPKGYYKKICNKDIDIKDEDGNYILRFRKNVIPLKNILKCYDSIIKHARIKTTTTRGMAGGIRDKLKASTILNNNKISSNIIGYFDTLSVRQKWIFRDAGMYKEKPICRQTRFTMQNPLKWKKIIPLIKDIDKQYKKLFPIHHTIQYEANQSTKFKIDNTAFSTITTNLNLQTACHYDKGDFNKGFGNLIVIEKGDYKGGYTGFPQYGIGVDVRTGDFLGMDVHLLHGNEPIELITDGAERLSLVSYLRQGIYDKCKDAIMFDKTFYDEVSKKAKKNRDKKTKKYNIPRHVYNGKRINKTNKRIKDK